jgi:hypothetical protein
VTIASSSLPGRLWAALAPAGLERFFRDFGISVTDMTIPGMGSYTARVMIFKDQFAGMWNAGDHGGMMSGKIEHTPPTTAPSPTP